MTHHICILGTKGVGRMALYNRLRWGVFVEKGYYDAPCDPTAILSIMVDGQEETYDIQTDYEEVGLRELAIQKFAHGFILVYSVEMAESLEKLAETVQLITRLRGTSGFAFVVVANKTDLDHKIPRQDGVEFAKRHNAPFIEVSCRNNTGLHEILPAIIREVKKRKPVQRPQGKQKERCIIC